MSTWNTFVTSGGIKSDVFSTYDKALKHFKDTKPIRGRAEELRPLGRNRAYTQCAIKHDPLTDSVTASLYGEECLSIDSDGLLKISHGRWITPTTARFIEACLPSAFGTVYLHRRRIIFKGRNHKEYVIPSEGLFLQASPNWVKVEVVPTQKVATEVGYEYKASRKVMNKLRKTYAGFLNMVDVMSAMSTNYTIGEMCEYFPDIAEL